MVGAFVWARWPFAYEPTVESQTELRAPRNIKSDLGEVWTRSGEDKICESVLMVRREKIGPHNTRLYPKRIM